MKSSKEKLSKKRIFEIIQIGSNEDVPSRVFDITLVIVIVLNIAMMLLETFDSMQKYSGIINGIEMATLAFFLIEYILRLWTADQLFPETSRGNAVAKFVFSFDGIIELLTILPFFFLTGFVAFRMLRVVRIFHLFRINSNYDSFNVIKSVIYEKKNQLLSSIFIILVLMLSASLFMYSAEHEAQPQNFKNAFSGIWWSVSTMLTIGYGDIYPVTVVGKIMAVLIAFLGVGAVAIPTGIISAGFVEQYTKATNSMEALDVNLHTVVIDIDSKWIGLSAKEVEEKYKAVIVLAKRGDELLIVNDNYRVNMKDALAVYNE